MIFGRFTVLATLFATLGSQLTAQEVVRGRPPVYESMLEAMLTPIDKVIEDAADQFTDDESGAVLIEERIDFIGEDGKFYRLFRQVNRANTQAGADAMEKETFGFSTSEE